MFVIHFKENNFLNRLFVCDWYIMPGSFRSAFHEEDHVLCVEAKDLPKGFYDNPFHFYLHNGKLKYDDSFRCIW